MVDGVVVLVEESPAVAGNHRGIFRFSERRLNEQGPQRLVWGGREFGVRALVGSDCDALCRSKYKRSAT